MTCPKVLAYEKVLKEKKGYYDKTYGITPLFKAGVHCGRVMIAEVGEIKKELAFHGDAINTAARIQSKCNEFGETLLISQILRSQMALDPAITFNLLGSIELKGKSEPVDLYAVHFNPDIS